MKFNIIFALSILMTSFSYGSEIELTDEQALELGMTPVVGSQNKNRNSQNKNFKFKDEYLDIATHVVLINKAVRSEAEPTGQTVRVFQNGAFLYEFETSTGTEKIKQTTSGRKYIATTPVGIFRPTRAFKRYQSYAFRGANMDYAVFFNGGIALHSTSKAAYARLGTRASGGCARLTMEDAKTVNEIIRSSGNGDNVTRSAGFEGLIRTQYYDRNKMNTLQRYTGAELNSKIWTYDTAVIVTDGLN